jgi:disulfide bond formation protein DsbB
MKPRLLLLLIAIASFALLGYALYLQHVKFMYPCPLCVIQRYAYATIGIFSLIGAIGNAPRPGAALSLLGALGGAGVAIHHVWIQAHPGASCGIDPVETALNRIFTAELLPSVFQASGACTTDYEPIMGLSIPQWSVVWFVLFSVALLLIVLRRR